MKFLAVLSMLAMLSLQGGDIYDVMNSSVQRLNKSNFNAIVVNGTQKENIYLVHFYEPNDGQSYQFTSKY